MAARQTDGKGKKILKTIALRKRYRNGFSDFSNGSGERTREYRK